MEKSLRGVISIKNSNILNIASDYLKQKQRKENAKKVAPVTFLCHKKNVEFTIDINKGITIGDKFFDFDSIDEAIKFVKELDTPNLDYYKR